MNRVVITGMALASPVGCDIDTAFQRLKKPENAVHHLKELDEYERLNSKLGALVFGFEVPPHFDRKVTRTMGRVALLSVVTAEQAVKDSGLWNDDILQNGKTGVSYGSSIGALDALLDFYSMKVDKAVKNINSGSYIKIMPHTTAVNISLYLKTTGMLIPTSSACTSGSMGIGFAYEAIRQGHQTIMLAGGAEELHPSHVAVFDTLYATSTKNDSPKSTPSPFDKDRDGLVIGEGAGTLVLEEYEHAKSRGARIYAEIIGFATNTDGAHITNPNAATMSICLKKALNSARVNPDDIGYVSAHGTATVQGDIAESIATYDAFKRPVPISSLKSYTGHTLGACGAIEAILTIKMMQNNWFSPTINLENLDENCAKLGYITQNGQEIATNLVMSNNFAFGGVNTSLIFKRI